MDPVQPQCVGISEYVPSRKAAPCLTKNPGYVVLFGVGSTLSMAAMSGLLGWPLARLGTHHTVARSIIFVVGFGSAALGVAWGNAALDLF